MVKREVIVSYTSEELKAMKSETNWALADREVTEEEIIAGIIAEGDEDPDEWDEKHFWNGLPPLDMFKPKPPKAVLTIRIDRDVLHWFRAHGAGYQTMINGVLRSFVRAAQPEAPRKAKRTKRRA